MKILDPKNKKLGTSFFIPFFIILLVLSFIYFDFLTFNKLYIFNDTGSDTFDSYWPFINDLHRTFRSGTFPFWSSNMGLGTNQYASNIFIGDPFFYIYLLFPRDVLPYLFGYMAILKSLFASWFFFRYLKYFNVTFYTCLIGSFLYGLNGYIVLWGQHYQFVNIIVFTPLLLWGFEKLLKENKIFLMVFSVALIAINSYYFLFQLSIFLFLYALSRYLIEHKFKIKHFLSLAGKSIGSYILGLGLSAVIVIPTIMFVLDSPRISGGVLISPFALNTIEYYITTLFRTISNNSMGIASEYFGHINYYEAPILFSTILSLILLPLSFFNMKRKERIIYGLLYFIFFLFLIFPFYSTMFNAFNKLDYRWTFLFITFNLFIFGFSVKKIESINRKQLLLTIFSFVLLITVYKLAVSIGASKLNLDTVKINYLMQSIRDFIIFGIIYILILFGITLKKQNVTKVLKIILIVVLMLELSYQHYKTVNNRLLVGPEYISTKQGYFDYTNEAINYLKTYNKELYRTKKDYNSRFLNDPLMQNYNGLTSYNSINHSSYINFLNGLDVPIYGGTNLINGLDNRQSLETLVGTRFLLSRQGDLSLTGYKQIHHIGDIYIYENMSYLPILFTYDKFIIESNFKKLDDSLKDQIILKGAVLEENIVESVKIGDIREIENSVLKISKEEVVPLDYSNIKSENIEILKNDLPSSLEFNAINTDPIITVPLINPISSNILLELTINSPVNSDGQIFWKSKNGIYKEEKSKVFPVKAGQQTYKINLGNINDLTEIRIDVSWIPGLFGMKNVYIKTIKNDQYLSDVELLKKEELKVTHYDPNFIKGNINLTKNKILYFSIPYDKGWTLKVNNQKMDIIKMNYGFFGVPLQRGNYDIELRYKPPYILSGAIISVFSLMVLIILYIRRKGNI